MAGQGGRPRSRSPAQMRRISSRATFYGKRIMPLVTVGILIASIALPLSRGLRAGQYLPLMPVVIGIIIFGMIFFFIWKKTVFELVDEVWDAGDALIIKNKRQEERVALSDIVNVSYQPIGGQRVTLLLRRPSVFGDRIHFCPPLRVLSFLGSPVIDDLIQRIDAKRRI
jgi:hypothetical protein